MQVTEISAELSSRFVDLYCEYKDKVSADVYQHVLASHVILFVGSQTPEVQDYFLSHLKRGMKFFREDLSKLDMRED